MTRASFAQPDSRQALDDRGKHARRNREVMQRPRRAAERLAQPFVCRGVAIIAVDVLESGARAWRTPPHRRRRALAGFRAHVREAASTFQRRSRDADDRQVEAPRAGSSTAAPGKSACSARSPVAPKNTSASRGRVPSVVTGFVTCIAGFSRCPPNCMPHRRQHPVGELGIAARAEALDTARRSGPGPARLRRSPPRSSSGLRPNRTRAPRSSPAHGRRAARQR